MKKLAILWLLVLPIALAAQTVNPAFNPKIYSHGRVFAKLLQPDGKMIIAGRFLQYNGITANNIVRLNANGTVDESFSVGSGAYNGEASYIAMQADGKILCRGYFEKFNGFAARQLVRLNTDGSVDQTFNASAAIETNFYDTGGPVMVQSDGKVVTTKVYIENNVHYIDVVRLNTNGSLDNTLQVRISGHLHQIVEYPGNKILLAGLFTKVNGTTANNIVLLSNTGAVENTFGTGTNNRVTRVVLQSTGKMILVGNFSNYDGAAVSEIIRLNTNFTRDASFVASGYTFNDIQIDGSDNIYLARNSSVQKLNPNGTQIYTYTTKATNQLLLQLDGKIFAFGYTQPSDQVSLRLNTNFTIDNTFTVTQGPRFRGQIQASDVQADGKIVIAGDFIDFNGHTCAGIVRLNPDFTIDETLTGTGFEVDVNWLYFDFVLCQPDNKIIISGQNDRYNGAAISGIIRINADGSKDPSFIAPRPFSITGAKLFEGYLYISNEYAPYLRRHFPYGTIDNTFAPVISGPVRHIDVQDEKILASGTFSTINGTSVPKLVRLNFDGTLDNSFTYTTTQGHNITGMQAYDSNILLDGTLTHSVSGRSSKLLMLGKNGEPFPDFEAPEQFDLNVLGRPVVLKDKSILIQTSTHLERILPTGKRDPLFTPITLNGMYVWGIIPVSESSFIYYSIETHYSAEKITLITVDPIPDPPLAPEIISIERDLEGYPVITWQDNSSDEDNFLIQRSTGSGAFSTLATWGNAASKVYEDRSIAENTAYRYRVVAASDYGMGYSNPVNFTSGLITGTEDELKSLAIYPNPSTRFVTLTFVNSRKRTVQVIGMNSEVVEKFETAEREVAIDLARVPAGMYCIRVSEGNRTKTVKVVKL